MSLKSWNVKLHPSEIEEANLILSQIKEGFDDPKNVSKREAFLKMLEDYTLKPRVELIEPEEVDLEDICSLKFLQKLKNVKTKKEEWFCLRMLNPLKSGKPIRFGNDIDSIKKMCNACILGYEYIQQRKLSEDQIKAIIRFGDSEIKAEVYVCTHPELEYIQQSLSNSLSFYCHKSRTRKHIKRTCIDSICTYLFQTSIVVPVKETEAFKDLKQQLEHKPQ